MLVIITKRHRAKHIVETMKQPYSTDLFCICATFHPFFAAKFIFGVIKNELWGCESLTCNKRGEEKNPRRAPTIIRWKRKRIKRNLHKIQINKNKLLLSGRIMKIFGKQKLIHLLYVRFSPANPLLLHFFVWVFLRFIRFVSRENKFTVATWYRETGNYDQIYINRIQ